jgi:hypothetical protein
MNSSLGVSRGCAVLLFFCLMSTGWTAALGAEKPAPIDYNRDIRPLLANSCYTCHGPDEKKREEKLRLDVREVAIKKAIIPGNADKSPLIKRLTTTDSDERMPPADSKKPALTDAQVELVRRWINEGAKFDDHWAYKKPVRAAVPKAQSRSTNPIDAFVLDRLKKEGLKPSPAADRRALIRRLSFDLLGLPPDPKEVDAFVADKSPKAYEKLVDRLLASKHYGERMAIYWLDVVRYADSNGYHSDNTRNHAPYRDYVIGAFNDNKPFDQFTREQLAGDLIPKATSSQKIASGFNRLNMTTQEGGAQPKEYRAIYAADRVRNTNAIFMAVSMGCCQCHDHKYDPHTMRDFYSFAAFFADIKETIVGRQQPVTLLDQTQTQKVYDLNVAIEKDEKKLYGPAPQLAAAQAKWETTKPKLKGAAVAALKIPLAKRNDQQKTDVMKAFRAIAPEMATVRQAIATAKKQQAVIKKQARKILISMTMKPRVVRILARGNWQDETGEIVQPAVPEKFGKLMLKKDQRGSRMDLANWLVSKDHPLTSRVFVNRMWKLMFGRGIVKTLGDFGTQGASPTHPELLDWLAVEFVESGWDVKHVIKLMVTSSTYQQSSNTTDATLKRDPDNRLLARQGRFRLDAELVRDNALKISGLLVSKIGGRAVKPYQPKGYWAHLNFPRRTYKHDTGENQYRRGVYTFWQRTFLHPSLLAFDAPTREECTVERPQSNTPLQALVLMNDPTYVESARVFAAKIIKEGGKSDAERLKFAYRRTLAREIKPAEEKLLLALLQKHRKQFSANSAEAAKIQKVGLTAAPKDVDPAELAAWTSIARTILNLHETITRS